MSEKRKSPPPFSRAKTCWTCKFSHGESGGKWGTTYVYCNRRYAGQKDNEFVDFVQYDEVCPLWEDSGGELEIFPLITGTNETLEDCYDSVGAEFSQML